MSNLYIDINKKKFLDQIKSAEEKSISEHGDDGKGQLLWTNLEIQNPELEVVDGTLNISFDTDIGYISFSYNMNMDDTEQLLKDVLKKLNKLKSLLETSNSLRRS